MNKAMAKPKAPEAVPKKAAQEKIAKNNPEFHKFSRLPFELRCMIIKRVCFFPRDVKIWERHHETARYLGDHDTVPERSQGRALNRLMKFATYHSSLKPPSILQVNQEFRREALRWYSLAFGTPVDANEVPMPKRKRIRKICLSKIYFNWKVDRLCIINPTCICRKYEFREFGLWDICRENQLVSLAMNCETGRASTGLNLRFVANFVLYSGIKNLTLFSADPQSRGSAFSLNPFLAGGAPQDTGASSTFQTLTELRTSLLRGCRTRGRDGFGEQLPREVFEASIIPCIELAHYSSL